MIYFVSLFFKDGFLFTRNHLILVHNMMGLIFSG